MRPIEAKTTCFEGNEKKAYFSCGWKYRVERWICFLPSTEPIPITYFKWYILDEIGARWSRVGVFGVSLRHFVASFSHYLTTFRDRGVEWKREGKPTITSSRSWSRRLFFLSPHLQLERGSSFFVLIRPLSNWTLPDSWHCHSIQLQQEEGLFRLLQIALDSD